MIATPSRILVPPLATVAATVVSLSPPEGALHHPKGCFSRAWIPRTREPAALVRQGTDLSARYPLAMSTAAATTQRSALLDPDEQRVIEERRARRLQRLAKRELLSIVASTAGFLATATLLALYLPSERSPGWPAVLLLVAAYAAAFRLDFEIGSGSAVPTALILVPMLFILPTGFVPLAVAAGIPLGGPRQNDPRAPPPRGAPGGGAGAPAAPGAGARRG